METFNKIPGFDKYLVSDLGNVKTLYDRHGKERLMKLGKTTHGYSRVTLNGKNYKVHQLVMWTFIGEQNGLDINHKNGIKTDNRLENLEYCTRSENTKHAFNKLGRVSHFKGKFGKDHPQSKGVGMYNFQGDLIKRFETISLGAKHVSGETTNISKCCKGKYKHAYGYIWKYIKT